MGIHRRTRLVADILLGFSILYLPWFVSLALFILFSFIFERYYEGVVGAVLFDLLYNTSASTLWLHNPFITTEIAFIGYIVIQYLRKRIIMLTE